MDEEAEVQRIVEHLSVLNIGWHLRQAVDGAHDPDAVHLRRLKDLLFDELFLLYGAACRVHSDGCSESGAPIGRVVVRFGGRVFVNLPHVLLGRVPAECLEPPSE
jgi:hypothetical protein